MNSFSFSNLFFNSSINLIAQPAIAVEAKQVCQIQQQEAFFDMLLLDSAPRLQLPQNIYNEIQSRQVSNQSIYATQQQLGYFGGSLRASQNFFSLEDTIKPQQQMEYRLIQVAQPSELIPTFQQTACNSTENDYTQMSQLDLTTQNSSMARQNRETNQKQVNEDVTENAPIYQNMQISKQGQYNKNEVQDAIIDVSSNNFFEDDETFDNLLKQNVAIPQQEVQTTSMVQMEAIILQANQVQQLKQNQCLSLQLQLQQQADLIRTDSQKSQQQVSNNICYNQNKAEDSQTLSNKTSQKKIGKIGKAQSDSKLITMKKTPLLIQSDNVSSLIKNDVTQVTQVKKRGNRWATMPLIIRLQLNTIQRDDVVLKSVMRSIRRYYLLKFNELTSFVSLKRKPKFYEPKNTYLACLKTFIQTIFNQQSEEQNMDSTLEKELLMVFGSMFYPKDFKISHYYQTLSSAERKQVDLIHKTTHSFTKIGMHELMRTNSAFRILIRKSVNKEEDVFGEALNSQQVEEEILENESDQSEEENQSSNKQDIISGIQYIKKLNELYEAKLY